MAQVYKQAAKIKQLKKQQDSSTRPSPDQDEQGEAMPKAMLTSEDVMKSMRNLNQVLETMNMNMLEEDRHVLVSQILTL